MMNKVQNIISFEKKKHPTEIKFQYIFSKTLVKSFAGKKWQSFKQVTKILADEVLTDKIFCCEENAINANAKQHPLHKK